MKKFGILVFLILLALTGCSEKTSSPLTPNTTPNTAPKANNAQKETNEVLKQKGFVKVDKEIARWSNDGMPGNSPADNSCVYSFYGYRMEGNKFVGIISVKNTSGDKNSFIGSQPFDAGSSVITPDGVVHSAIFQQVPLDNDKDNEIAFPKDTYRFFTFTSDVSKLPTKLSLAYFNSGHTDFLDVTVDDKGQNIVDSEYPKEIKVSDDITGVFTDIVKRLNEVKRNFTTPINSPENISHALIEKVQYTPDGIVVTLKIQAKEGMELFFLKKLTPVLITNQNEAISLSMDFPQNIDRIKANETISVSLKSKNNLLLHASKGKIQFLLLDDFVESTSNEFPLE